MRSTWLDPNFLSFHLNLKVKIVFFVGSSSDEIEQEMMKCESALHKDIVQSSFLDDYMYNTYKVMSFLK